MDEQRYKIRHRWGIIFLVFAALLMGGSIIVILMSEASFAAMIGIIVRSLVAIGITFGIGMRMYRGGSFWHQVHKNGDK